MRESLTDRRAWPLIAALLIGGVLIYLLRGILTPFLAGALLAYLGDPLADRLEKLGLNRTGAVAVVFVGLVVLVTGALVLLVPMLARQIELFYRQLPAMLAWLQSEGLPYLERTLGTNAGQLDIASLRAAITENWQSTGSIAGTILAQITSSGLALLATLANLALIPVVTFYLLRDWDTLIARIRDLIPRRNAVVVARLAQECNDVVAEFLRGQLLVMVALGAVYALGLWLVGLDLALIIGLTAGVANLVPYLGFIVGISAASIAALFQFSEIWLPLALVWGVFLVGQVLEGAVLTPLLVGDRIGLHPVAVIFAVLAAGQLFGFTGVLLALPAAAMVMVLLRHAHRRYMTSALYVRASRSQSESSHAPPRAYRSRPLKLGSRWYPETY